MTRGKKYLPKKLIVLCALFLLLALLPVAAIADGNSTTVTTDYIYPYFYIVDWSTGQQLDIGTPSHTIVDTGAIAYCLQTLKESPYSSNYSTIRGSDYYSNVVLTGLEAILENGYPVTNGGFPDDQARYATANAIRFWLAENRCDGMPSYLTVDDHYIRGKSGYEKLYDWAVSLLQLARDQTVLKHEISFSQNSVVLEEGCEYFTGTVTVSLSNCSGGYSLDSSGLPPGSSIYGYFGRNGDCLTIKIPTNYEQKTYSIVASGIDNRSKANMFFYAPANDQEQRIVSYILDQSSPVVTAELTIKTPKVTPKNGTLQLTKVNENGTHLPGISFALYDSGKNEIQNGQTDSNGIISFEVPIGDYFYCETATLPHLVLDSTMYPISITEGGQLVTKTAVNEFARGNVSVLKVNEETGEPLSSVHFRLFDSGGNLVAEGDTPEDGTLTFTGLLLGSYTLQETATREGFVLDTTPIPVEVAEHGKTYTVTAKNTPIRGHLKIVKLDAYEDTPLSGAGFRLFDSGGHLIDEGYTDESGELTFENLLYGSYLYQEFCPPKGYTLDDTVYPFSITEHGVTITQERDNLRRPGTLEVKKQDQNGKPLAGASFLLEYSTDNGASWAAVFSRDGDNIQTGGCTSPGLSDGQLNTDGGGAVTFSGLRADSSILYRLTETQAPVGHSLLGSPLYVGTLPVEISGEAADSETVDGVTYCYTLYVTATDDPLFRIPETGGAGFAWLPLFMGFMTMPYIITKRKDESET